MGGETIFVYALPVCAYLLGSVPWGVVLTRLFAPSAVDVRKQGSGNIGATNVARLAGPGLGLATLAADLLKGLAPVVLAEGLMPGGLAAQAYATGVALLALGGHLFPVYTGFRGGGKGVATAAGGFLALAPAALLIALAAFLVVAAASRRVSAGSLAAFAALPVAVYLTTGSAAVCAGAGVAAIFIFMRHAGNISRLIAGTEPAFRLGRRPGCKPGSPKGPPP